MTGHESRFAGVRRLLGAGGLERLRRAHVCVVGLGGVGSWAVEALARSGVGALTLVDLDDVCVSNMNRQLHALDQTVGRPKVEVMGQRVRAINPECVVRTVAEFFAETNADQLLAPCFDGVIDAIDSPSKKALLIARCRERGLTVVTSGGAAGRRDPTAIRVADLALATHDRLLAEVRRLLRQRHGFPRGGQPFGVECVFSSEPAVFPQRDGSVCDRRDPEWPARNDCEHGLGTAAFVTGAFGLAAAAAVVRQIVGSGPAPEARLPSTDCRSSM